LRSRKKVMIEVSGVGDQAAQADVPLADEPAPIEPERRVEPPRTEPVHTESARPEPASAEAAAPEEPAADPYEGSMLMDDDDEEIVPEPKPEKKRRRKRKPRTRDSHVALAESPVSASSRFPAAEGEEAEAAARALERILDVAAVELEHRILQGEDQLEIELWGEDQDILLRDRGRLLLAIQHLLPRAIRGLIGHSVVCRIDSDSFHEIREERLRDMAQRAADEVREGGRTKKLEPMSPDERRIVHLTLADYPGVETESQGTGLFKRVMVRPSGGGRSRSYSR
jgi:spoIIIJ-associated protein